MKRVIASKPKVKRYFFPFIYIKQYILSLTTHKISFTESSSMVLRNRLHFSVFKPAKNEKNSKLYKLEKLDN